MSKNEDNKAAANTDITRHNHYTRCHDCGHFLKKRLWVSKKHSWKKHALCLDCLSKYDSPHDY